MNVRRLVLLAVLLVAVSVLAWRLRPPSRNSARTGPPEGALQPAPPDGAPRESNFVTALALSRGNLYAGSEAGIVRFDSSSGAYTLLVGEPGAPLTGVTDLCAAPDGSIWSAHHSSALPEEGADAAKAADARAGAGGVRMLPADGSAPGAWHAADGLGSDDVSSIAAGVAGVAAGVGRSLAILDTRVPGAAFESRFGDDSRRVLLIDLAEGTDSARSVAEFRPRGEEVLCIAASGSSFHVGTTHGLYRLSEEGLVHLLVPCREDHQVPSRVVAIASMPLAAGAPFGGVVATLGVPVKDGTWRPGGLLEVRADLVSRCHAAGFDVARAPALDVACEGGTIWLATHAGLMVIRGNDVVLLDHEEGAPQAPVVALVPDGAGGCWVGTWGAGVWHVAGNRWQSYRFDAREGVALPELGTLRD